MAYGVLAALLGLVTFLYFHTKEQYDWEYQDRRKKEDQISHLEDVRCKLSEQINKYYCQQKQDFEYVLKNEINRIHKKGLYTRYAAGDILRMITDNGYIIGVNTIQDINYEHFEKTIKAALYADNGYLSICQSDRYPQYRLGKHGEHIPLSDEECEKIKNNDFDFIYDSLKLF